MVYEDDDAFQRRKRDEILVPFYSRISDRFFFIDGNDLLCLYTQKRMGIDTVLSRGDKLISVEEKIVRKPRRREHYGAFFFETESCTIEGREKDGWMRYCQADVLFYCFETDSKSLDCYWIRFPELREWFFFNEEEFPVRSNKVNNQMSKGRVVEIHLVCNAVTTKRYVLTNNQRRSTL